MSTRASPLPDETAIAYAARYCEVAGCRGCGEKRPPLNPKSLYCTPCHAFHEECLSNIEKRRAMPAYQESASYAALGRPKRWVGVTADEGMSDFMNEVDWQDALHPNEGDR